MNTLCRVNKLSELLEYIKHPPQFVHNWPDILIVEGVRGTGKTTLIDKLQAEFNVPVYSTFQYTAGGRKGVDWAGAQIDPGTTAFTALDAVSQMIRKVDVSKRVQAIIDRGFISTMVFNEWTHGRLTFARKQWREHKVWHILVRTCIDKRRETGEKRMDCDASDLYREDDLYRAAFDESGVPVIVYDNLDVCGHDKADRDTMMRCRSLGTGSPQMQLFPAENV